MKTNILTLLFFTATLHVTAQETEHSSVYIQTKDGLCLSNQNIEEELALIRFLDPESGSQSNKWYLDTLDNQCIVLHNNTFAADNVEDCFLNLFQRTKNTKKSSQQWIIQPVPNKKGYYYIQSANFPGKNWEVNYNGTVCLSDSNYYHANQWFRISETLLERDDTVQVEEEPVYTLGTQDIVFSTEDAPVWYQMTPHYASSPNIKDARLVSYYNQEKGNWLVKGASNTHLNALNFYDPDLSLWRLEGTAQSFYLINKATGMKLAYPTQCKTNERYTLNEAGSLFQIHKSNTQNNKMQPDAYYIDPVDPQYAQAGRVHVEGVTTEFILFKNGMADVISGCGSSLIFMPVKMKTVMVTTQNSSLGDAVIMKDIVASKYDGEKKIFIFSPSNEAEKESQVCRAANNTVICKAIAKEGAKFIGWIDKNGNEISKDETFAWTGETDQVLTATFESTTEESAYDQLDKLIKEAINLHVEVGHNPGEYTPESADSFIKTLEKAQQVLKSPNSLPQDYLHAKDDLKQAISQLTYIFPQENKLYRFRCAAQDNRKDAYAYLNANIVSDHDKSESNTMYWDYMTDDTDAKYVWKVEKRNDELQVNSLLSGDYIGNFMSNNATALSSEGLPITFNLIGEKQFNIMTNNNMMHAQSTNQAIVGWNQEGIGQASAWFIEEVDPTTLCYKARMGQSVGIPLYLNFAVTLPESVSAYAITEVSNDTAYIKCIASGGNILPEKTPALLLKNDGYDNVETVNLMYTVSTEACMTQNLLQGAVVDTYIKDKNTIYYNLHHDNGRSVMQQMDTSDSQTYLQANHAYLILQPSEALHEEYILSERGITTSLESVTEQTKKDIRCFDLSGRRISKITSKGLYIINGKKIIKK